MGGLPSVLLLLQYFFQVYKVNPCQGFVVMVLGIQFLGSPCQRFVLSFSYPALDVSCLVAEPTFDCSVVVVLLFLILFGVFIFAYFGFRCCCFSSGLANLLGKCAKFKEYMCKCAKKYFVHVMFKYLA